MAKKDTKEAYLSIDIWIVKKAAEWRQHGHKKHTGMWIIFKEIGPVR